MGKVKKYGAVRKKSVKRSAKAPKTRRRVTKVASVAHKVARTAKSKQAQRPELPLSSFRVRELDPTQKCGAGTSVQRLFRIDESIGGTVKPHLVFLDRHGWYCGYCEHGPTCPAVPHARKAADAGMHDTRKTTNSMDRLTTRG